MWRNIYNGYLEYYVPADDEKFDFSNSKKELKIKDNSKNHRFLSMHCCP